VDVTKIKPGPKKVLIHFVPKRQIGSIIVPDTAIERDRDVGIVVSVGSEVDWINPGDEAILSPSNLGASVPDTDRRYGLFDADDVWGVADGVGAKAAA